MAIYNENIVDIELNSGSIFRSFLSHTIGSGDVLANRFGVRVFRDGEPEAIGGTCFGLFIRADGGTVAISSGTVSGNVAYVDLTEACYAVEGQFALAIKCQGGGVTGTLRIVDGVVSRTSTSVTVDPGTIIPSVEDMIEAIEDAVESIPSDYSGMWTTFAPAFSTETAYKAGQYVTYNGKMYKFTTDHAAGTWNSAHVTQVNVGGETSDLKSAIIKNATENYTKIYNKTDNLLDTSIIGKWYPNNYGGSQAYAVHSDIFPVTVGDTYYYAINNVDSTKFGTNFRMIVNTVDSSNAVVRTLTSYKSGDSHHASLTIESGEVGIVATLSTREYSIPITVNDILLSSMYAYLGKTDVIGDAIYGMYDTPIPELQNKTQKSEDALAVGITWANGTIDSSGNIYYRADRINTGKIKTNISSIEVINGYMGLVAYYDADGAKISVGSFTENLSVKKSSFPSNAVYLAIALRNAANTNISTTEGKNCIIYYSVDDIVKEEIDVPFSDFPYVIGSTNQICRLGWMPYSNDTPPEQSLASYALAYQKGCRIMLCDMRVTQDGTIVCYHDADLGAELSRNMVRHTDGTTLTAEEKAQTIASLTITELDTDYDFGVYKGSEYAGTKILRLDDFLKWCSLTNCYPMLETKVQFTQSQIQQIAGMCKKYQLMKRVIVADGYDDLDTTISWWIANFPDCVSVVRGGTAYYSARLENAKAFANAGIETYISFTTTASMTDERLSEMYGFGIGAEFSEIESASAMSDFYDAGFVGKVRMIVSSYINIQDWILKKIGVK